MATTRTLTGVRYGMAVLLALIFSSAAVAGNTRSAQSPGTRTSATALPSIAPRELVRRTIDNELKAAQRDSTPYMYKNRRQTPSGSKTKLMIETKDGTVAYLVAVNDQPLTPEQRAGEQQRLQALLSNPEERERKRKEQQQDGDRVLRLMRELPNAFLYEYDGVVPGTNGHQWVRLKFTPDPKFRPPSRETSVLKAMNGELVIDPSVERLVKIEATLFKDVSFGWGILGHLDRGGHFFVEQTNIGDGRWMPTYMNLQFTGKVLFFKTVNLRQIETASEFVRVPSNMTMAQGVEFLKKRVDSELATTGRGRK
ncbi:MAG TPA: hypothetical protein VD837_08345 [Terriglobales bacterium]|nr:hypothetical protein [Terriglobales bacterium]